MQYQIMGEGFWELYGPATQSDCRAWLKGYIKHGDWGGWQWFTLVDCETGETLDCWERD